MDDTKKALVFTNDTVGKGENTDMLDKKMKTKPNVVKEAITPPISENKYWHSQQNREITSIQKKLDTLRSNKTDKVKSIDKSRSNQITDTENTVYK